MSSYRISSNMNVTQLLPIAVSNFCLFPLTIHLRCREHFRRIAYINSAVVWISLSRHYVVMLTYVMLTYGLYVWNSNLTIGSSKIGSSLIFNHLRCFLIKLNDCKNLTYDTVSFLLLNDRIFLIVPLAKIMSLICFACLFRTSISRCRITLSMSPPYIQSNGDFFSTKIE